MNVRVKSVLVVGLLLAVAIGGTAYGVQQATSPVTDRTTERTREVAQPAPVTESDPVEQPIAAPDVTLEFEELSEPAAEPVVAPTVSASEPATPAPVASQAAGPVEAQPPVEPGETPEVQL